MLTNLVDIGWQYVSETVVESFSIRSDVQLVTLGGLRAVNCEISLARAYVTVWCGLRDRVHVEFGPPRI